MLEIGSSDPWKIGWGFTAACNMACPFCYSRSVRQPGHQPEQEVPLPVASDFVRQNASDIASINFGTGESTLSPAWFELVEFIHAEFPTIRMALTTNGTLAANQDRAARLLLAKAIAEVDVSIDFADRQQHNRMRGNIQAYDWAVHTLDLCAEQGIVTTIVTVGLAETLAPFNLEQLLKLAGQHHAFLRLNILRPVPPVRIAPPTLAQVYTGIEWLVRNARVVSLCDPLFGVLFDPEYSRLETTGVTRLRILPDGSLTPSTYLIGAEWKGASLHQAGLRLGHLVASPAFRRVRQAPIPTECATCRQVKICRGGAIDRRILHFQTLERGDPFCPYLNHHPAPSPGLLRRLPPGAVAPSVHDGYLPTLIFAP